MSEQVVIDSLAFAQGGQAMQGEIPLAKLARVRESLLQSDGVAHYALRGGTNQMGKPALWLDVSADLVLTCQRCLEPMVLPVRSAGVEFVLVDKEPESDSGELEEDSEGDVEWLVANRAQDVLTLVEDEILLSLPYAPRHENCAPKAEMAETGAKNPFAALAALKKPQ